MRRRIVVVVLVAALLAVAFLATRSSPLPVEMAEVSRRDVIAYIAEDAKTRLADEYTIDMPVNGTLRRIALDEGAVVKAGEVIAEVDPFDLDQEIAQVQAQIRQADAQTIGVDTAKPKSEDIDRARLQVQEMRDNLAMMRREQSVATINFEDAERDYQRLSKLQNEGVVSQSEFDRAKRSYLATKEQTERARYAVEAAEKNIAMAEKSATIIVRSVDDNEYMREYYAAQRDLLRARLHMLEDDRTKTQITSPVDGVLLEKMVEDSLTLPAGKEILQIGDLNSIEIECDVLSEEVVRVTEGDRVIVTGKAVNDREIDGRVDRIYPSGFKKISSLGIEQQRVRVIIAFDNESAGLRPGTSVDVRIVTDEAKSVLAVPEPATFRREGKWYTFVVTGGKARMTELTIGLKNDDWAEIRTGLNEGDTVIAETRNELNDGAAVTRITER